MIKMCTLACTQGVRRLVITFNWMVTPHDLFRDGYPLVVLHCAFAQIAKLFAKTPIIVTLGL